MTGDVNPPNPESVDALVSVVQRLADDERARSGALTARAANLAGFAGTILASSATLAVGGALRGRRRQLVDVGEVREFADDRWVSRDATEIKRIWLVSLSETLGTDRANNDRRARLAEAAAVALLVGLLAVAAQAIVLGVDAILYNDAPQVTSGRIVDV
jgi:ABC-type dipeptide/oligopeptide/nickel transport system permease subunit